MRLRALHRLPEPLRQEWRALTFFGVVLILTAGLFFAILEEVYWDDPLMAIDQMTYHALQALRTPMLDVVMTAITQLGDTWVVVAVTAAVVIWLIHLKRWRSLLFWLMAIGGGSLINSAIKLALQRARPGDLSYDGVSLYSFPSGHSTTNAVLYGFLLILLARELPRLARIPVVTGFVMLVALIAFSRLYLGAHWLSDVVGGLAFGSAWLALLAMFYTWKPVGTVEPRRLVALTVATLVVAGGVNIALNHAVDLKRYAPAEAAS